MSKIYNERSVIHDTNDIFWFIYPTWLQYYTCNEIFFSFHLLQEIISISNLITQIFQVMVTCMHTGDNMPHNLDKKIPVQIYRQLALATILNLQQKTPSSLQTVCHNLLHYELQNT